MAKWEKDRKTNNDVKFTRLRSTNLTNNLGKLECSVKVSSSCSTSVTRRGTLVEKPVISHE